GVYHVEAAAPAELVAHRHHDAAREARGKGVGLTVARLERPRADPAALELGRKPLGVVALGKGDRGRDGAKILVLVEQPKAFEVPPFGAVEQVIEAHAGKPAHLGQTRAERLGREQAIARLAAGGSDEPAPDTGR